MYLVQTGQYSHGQETFHLCAIYQGLLTQSGFYVNFVAAYKDRMRRILQGEETQFCVGEEASSLLYELRQACMVATQALEHPGIHHKSWDQWLDDSSSLKPGVACPGDRLEEACCTYKAIERVLRSGLMRRLS